MTRNKSVELSTIIGEGSKLIGTLKVDGGLRVNGYVEGSLESNGFITIGLKGEAKADIKAKECLISGKVTGNVIVEEGLELDKTAVVEGDIISKSVKIQTGAVFNGKSSMVSSKSKTVIK